MKKNTPQKPDYVHGTFKIASTDILDYDYKEFCDWYRDLHGKNAVIPDENSREFWNWAADTRDDNWECDLATIEFCKQYRVPVILTGELGLWNSRPTIVPEKFNSVIEAVRRLLGTDCNDWDISYVDGHLEVQGHHHDGTNCFEIHALSRKGLRKAETAERNWEDIPEPKAHDLMRLPYLYAV